MQKNESVRIEVTFTKEQMETFEKVKDLMSHVNPSATVAALGVSNRICNCKPIESADCGTAVKISSSRNVINPLRPEDTESVIEK